MRENELRRLERRGNGDGFCHPGTLPGTLRARDALPDTEDIKAKGNGACARLWPWLDWTLALNLAAKRASARHRLLQMVEGCFLALIGAWVNDIRHCPRGTILMLVDHGSRQIAVLPSGACPTYSGRALGWRSHVRSMFTPVRPQRQVTGDDINRGHLACTTGNQEREL
nr:hypothetical protein CFP56_00673 [Quercus suber]